MPKRVLQSCLSKSWGGLEMVAYENAISLTKNGFECHTLCFEGSPLEQHLKALNLSTVSIRKKPFDFLKVRSFIKKHGIQYFLVQMLKDLKLLSVAAIGIPEINMIAIAHMFIGVNKKDFIHRWVYGKLQTLICLTQNHKENLLEFLPLKESQIAVLPNFVDCEKFNPRNRSEEVRASMGGMPGIPLMGTASRLDPQKGQGVALEALKILKQKNIPLRLVIVGENTKNEMNYLDVLKKMSKDLGIEDLVHFTGYRSDMDKIIASLDVLLMPSDRETFGRVLIEAMASKTPVIATNAGGVPNIIDNNINGLLVEPKNPQDLAIAMEKLATQTDLRQTLAEGGYQKAQSTYSKDVVEKKFLGFFD
ncbi:glycosyltransferase family 4 protein [Bdellovibrio sp. HCB337]|uniref:glycosyltransferase family 4 protein n=1 Tax=Bdellovibrio sp. HCB337 TaxID=3394358 RepID=UPI0039A62BF3